MAPPIEAPGMSRKEVSMRNVKIYLQLVNGDSRPLQFGSGRELIERLFGDDFGPPPVNLVLEARTQGGRTVRVLVPYDDVTAEAHVSIDQ
jgi:hypothetical protein